MVAVYDQSSQAGDRKRTNSSQEVEQGPQTASQWMRSVKDGMSESSEEVQQHAWPQR